jgi:hypothetical protein
VPCHPTLARYLLAHLRQFGTARDGRLFRGERGGDLSESVYNRVWDQARSLALPPALSRTPIAGRPYDLRHACLSTWLNGGVDQTQVAEWAGNSVKVLMDTYAKCIDGHDEINRKRMEAAYRIQPAGRHEGSPPPSRRRDRGPIKLHRVIAASSRLEPGVTGHSLASEQQPPDRTCAGQRAVFAGGGRPDRVRCVAGPYFSGYSPGGSRGI